jgi:UDP-3-O-[3-hydroxymyristoyl] N-acetylglucosamine deacetylase
LKQQTLRREVSCTGTGLHSGRRVTMRLKPAPADFGICFCRVDLPGQPTVKARYDHVVHTERATTLGYSGVEIATTEHLLAAFLGSGVDNALVELDAAEVPIFDGSASPYLVLLRNAGLEQQSSYRKYLKVTRGFVVHDGDSFVRVWPAEKLQISYTIDFAHPLVGRQSSRWSFDPASFARDIAGARTFGFLKDLHHLQTMGLALGGSLTNAIVFDDCGLLNRGGFRFVNECVRHKVLDLIGDIALAGLPIIAQFEAYKAGHTLHNKLVRELLTRPDRYVMVTPIASRLRVFPMPRSGSMMHPIAPLAAQSS